MNGLQSTLNSMFSAPKREKRKPCTYVAIRGDVRSIITKNRAGLWACEIYGQTYSNSLLRDLKWQLASMGFDVLAASQ